MEINSNFFILSQIRGHEKKNRIGNALKLKYNSYNPEGSQVSGKPAVDLEIRHGLPRCPQRKGSKNENRFVKRVILQREIYFGRSIAEMDERQ